MKNSKRTIIFAIILIAIVIITVGGAYAYFLASLGETRNEVVKVQAGTMELTFSDNDTLGNIERTLNFGDTVEKELKIENNGTLDAYAKISWDDLTNTFLDGSLTYTLEYKTSETGTYQPTTIKNNKVPTSSTTSKRQIVDHLKIPSGSTYIYKITITYNNLDVDQTSDLNATFATKFTLDEGSNKYTSDEILAYLNLKSKRETPNFVNAAMTDETKDGLYALEDNYGTSYYYRGAVENNYVKFGKNKAGQDMYWRIIRFNGDGSARLIYDGTQAFANGTADDSRYAITNQPWNMNTNDAKYVGWMFGGADGTASTSKEEAQRNETDSDIKEKVDEWYVDNIQETGYSKYLTDAIFCNDRSIPGNTGWKFDTGLGFGTNKTVYGTVERFQKVDGNYFIWKTSNIKPNFSCKSENDIYTLKDNDSPEVIRIENEKVVGNKALTYPVGLITADEIVTAGSGVGIENRNYYLYKSSNYYGWSLSPNTLDGNAGMFIVYTNNSLSATATSSLIGAAAPVINLSAQYVLQLQGEGSQISPYYLTN